VRRSEEALYMPTRLKLLFMVVSLTDNSATVSIYRISPYSGEKYPGLNKPRIFIPYSNCIR